MHVGSTSTGYYSRVYAPNHWYDLDATGAGHQPAYFDMWSTLYDRYVSSACKLTVTAVNTNSNPLYCVVYPKGNTTVDTLTID